MEYLSLLAFATGPFVLYLTVGELIFTRNFRRRNRFALRLILALILELVLGSIVYAACIQCDFWPIQSTLCYMLLFLICLLMPFLCYEEPPASLVLCGISGYMVQHIGTQIFQMLVDGREVFSEGADVGPMLVAQGINLLILGIVAGSIWRFAARENFSTAASPSVNRRVFALSIATLAVVLVLSSVRDAFAGESFALMAVSRLFSIFCCVFLLYMRYGILELSRKDQEREDLLRLHALERKQYEQSRENIELINIKCHDLKHRMERWENGRLDPEEVRQVREMIGIYDSAIKTGNEALDVLLSERSLYCEKHGIRLSCMIDGAKLGFMPVGDVYSLFGNALENAIEAVSRLNDPEERVISLQVRKSRGMLVISVENNYDGNLSFDGDLPCTTKTEDPGYHGYGLKSIRMVAEQYGGQMTVMADELFHLTVLIPLPEDNSV